MKKPRIVINGDCGIEVVFGQKIECEINRMVHIFSEKLRQESLEGVLDIIPSYASVLIDYNPLVISYKDLVTVIESKLEALDTVGNRCCEVVYIPVLYGGRKGMDLAYLADYHKLSIEEVVELHTRPFYRVFMLGFKPGFPYLGGMSPKLETPRLKSPRISVEAGSVGIAGNQTGVYPQDSPGGWQIIGHTPLQFVDWRTDHIALLKPGQYVKFYSIDLEAYNQINEAVKRGTFQLKIENFEEAPI